MADLTIYLIRHGENDWTGRRLPGRLAGLGLNAQGKAQADRLAIDLGAVEFDAIYSSPMARARQTAAPLARALGLDVGLLPGLNEMDAGDWAGRRIRELARTKAWRQVVTAPSSTRIPGGESFVEMQARVVSAVENIWSDHPDGRVACFSHADPIKAFVAHALGMPLDAFGRLHVAPASVTVLSYRPGGFPAAELHCLNATLDENPPGAALRY